MLKVRPSAGRNAVRIATFYNEELQEKGGGRHTGFSDYLTAIKLLTLEMLSCWLSFMCFFLLLVGLRMVNYKYL